MFDLRYALDLFHYSNKDGILFSGFLLELECNGTRTAMINIPGLQQFPELPQSETISSIKTMHLSLAGLCRNFFLNKFIRKI